MTDDRSRQDLNLSDEKRSGGHPLIATLICAVLLIFASAGGGSQDTPEGSDGLAYLIGYLAGGGFVAAILWAIAYAITIKRASNGWRVGSLLALIVIGLLSGLLKLGAHVADVRSDARDTARQFRQVMEGKEPPDHVAAGSGPMSRMSAASMNRILEDRRGFDRDLAAAEVAQVVSFGGLTRTSPVLRRCGDFARIAARARTLGTEGWGAALAAGRQVGDAAVTAGEMSAADEAAFFDGAQGGHANYQRQWELNAEMVEEAQAVCNLLASRPWVRSGGRVLFTRPGDAEAVNGHLQRIRANNAEQDRIREESRARSHEQIETMER